MHERCLYILSLLLHEVGYNMRVYTLVKESGEVMHAGGTAHKQQKNLFKTTLKVSRSLLFSETIDL